MHPILSVQNLSTGYGKRQVLFKLSLDVMHNEIVLITGGNGSGKSTLLKAIYGLLPAWNAEAEIVFRPCPNASAIDTRQANNNLKNGLAYLPQKNAVFDTLTVEDNLRLAGHILRDRNLFDKRRDEILTTLPKLASLLGRKAERMSGGERQMLALAMTLLHRPRLILLDEPTAGLGYELAQEIYVTLREIRKNSASTIIVVEHRKDSASLNPDWIARVNFGRLQPPIDNLA